eukprot:1909331-Prymnesium_polylepis.1
MLCTDAQARPSGRGGGYMGWVFTAVGGLRTLASDPSRVRSVLDYGGEGFNLDERGTPQPKPQPRTHASLTRRGA